MIAADQNSRVHDGVTLDAVNHPSCVGCHFFNAPGDDCKASHRTLCTSSGREDRRSIIWVARDFTANPATVAADILRAQGEDVDEAAVKRAEAVCEELAPGSEFADEPPIFTDWADAFSIVFDDPAYASLGRVLTRAYAQAATGKGAERHGRGQPFERQPMQDLIRLHGVGFATGQASKKAQEALRLPRARAVAELLGAINYLAGAVIAIEAGDTHHQP